MIGEVYCPKAGTTEGLWKAHAGGIEEDGQEESEMVQGRESRDYWTNPMKNEGRN